MFGLNIQQMIVVCRFQLNGIVLVVKEMGGGVPSIQFMNKIGILFNKFMIVENLLII